MPVCFSCKFFNDGRAVPVESGRDESKCYVEPTPIKRKVTDTACGKYQKEE